MKCDKTEEYECIDEALQIIKEFYKNNCEYPPYEIEEVFQILERRKNKLISQNDFDKQIDEQEFLMSIFLKVVHYYRDNKESESEEVTRIIDAIKSKQVLNANVEFTSKGKSKC